ncbi:tetratricopeptide repeat protein [Vibrio sp. 99-8-1]|uniref:tetratricopeptide repeat protein n=1 Tax=Vibrio sp. 99-8-1 TaxID=2607602 RepID=UPI001493A858|nr:tetratricopeptide repeat protein [Vibrio sp. 99-8-1]NOI67054.1 tetratricopeptide repeat protein [Vibrio sp. 99-8-1]
MRYSAIILSLVIVGCSSTESQKIEDTTPSALLSKAIFSIQNNKSRIAMEKYLNPLIKHCNSEVKSETEKVYSARSKKEEDFYKSKTDTNGRTIRVIDGTCADAHFFAGYVNVELNNVDAAEYYLINGLNISPQNSRILSELGNIYQNKKLWDKTLTTYKKAQVSAKLYSPTNRANMEYSRALRGIGFVLIEQGKLDDASTKYHEALEINSKDKIALAELRYIEKLKLNK